ncbi:hypothetical protein JD974_04165 [Chromobacterium haemolyticum]|uniref:DNA-binding protein n=1 Tax=Chromobacterium haemolyticum TaxID=394935 RepID=A0ABS3GKC7_9NEIS|nr:hypothetical protein [Chromobacterium haemolyticum]MBK0413596.1 hypothetical protein [Chromobacterium haemolyticum]MBO0414698.1 hypothetical protein [Chromobacterium haemolyticum]MBO0497958.1 hypothetical protein [Chromobacterium haemolyticum]
MGKRLTQTVSSSLSDAINRQEEAASKIGLVPKRMSDLMGVELKTYYRWLADNSMPLNRVRQFETFCKASYISEYLCTAHGDKVVIAIPSGRAAKASDLGEMQANFGEVIMLLEQCYRDKTSVAETLALLGVVLSQAAYHRENIRKIGQPELDFCEGQA